MNKLAIISVATVLVVGVIGGVVFISGSIVDTDDTPPPENPTGERTDSSPDERTDSATNTDTSDFEDLSARQAISQHQSGLKNAESYSLSNTQVVDNTEINITDTETTTLSLSSETSYTKSSQIRNLGSSETQVYFKDGVRYSRSVSDGSEQFSADSGTVTVSASDASNTLRLHIEAIAYGPERTVTIDGVEATEYSLQEVTDVQAITGNAESTIENADSTLVVDERGIIQQFSFNAVINRPSSPDVTVEREFKYTNIGTTTVEEPDWFGRAQSETTPPGTDAPATNSTG